MENPIELMQYVLHAIYDWMHIDYDIAGYRFNFWEVFVFVIVGSVAFWCVRRLMDADDE
jgi:hypothetical protein